MAAAAHLRELENKHSILDQKIKTEMKSPQPDNILITTLKKQKLFLKEQILATQES